MAKSGILCGTEVPKSREASQNARIDASRYLECHSEKIYKAWTKISYTTGVVKATIVAPGGPSCQNMGFWVDWRY